MTTFFGYAILFKHQMFLQTRTFPSLKFKVLFSLYAHLVLQFLLFFVSDIVVDNCAICRNHIMDLCKYSYCNFRKSVYMRLGNISSENVSMALCSKSEQITSAYHESSAHNQCQLNFIDSFDLKIVYRNPSLGNTN